MKDILSTKLLTKKFGSFAALRDVSFNFGSERIHSVIGPNGAGKTTLFNLITGTIPSTSGAIYFQGKEITNKRDYIRSRMGIARSFQITNIFPAFTVFENVRLGVQSVFIGGYKFFAGIDNYREITERTQEIIEFTNLTHLKDRESGILAHGDQRNLEIAIALAGNAKILLLDEPTAGMSRKEIGETSNLMKKISDSVPVLLVEHRMDIIMSISDIITVLHEGQILATGTPAEIKSNSTVKKAYLGE